MSAAVESPLSSVSPSGEKTFEEICMDWLQFDTTEPSTPQPTAVTAFVGHNVPRETSLWLGSEQWTFPVSPRLPFTDVQSPTSFRPYGTPLVNDPSAVPSEECYFSHAYQLVPIQTNEASYHPYTTSTRPNLPSDGATNMPTTSNPPSGQQEALPPAESSYDQTSKPVPQTRTSNTGTVQYKRKLSLSVDDPVRIKQYGKCAGMEAGILVEWGKQPQGRSKMEGESLASYRVNRKYRACSICKRGRRRCGRSCFPYIECLSTKPLVFLDRPTNIRLFRSGPSVGHPLFSEKPELYKLRDLSLSPNVSLDSISQGILGLSLPIQITEFQPHATLKTARVYITPTGKRVLEMPRLCLASVDSTTKALQAYIEQSWYLYLQEIMLSADNTTRRVLREAIQYTTNGRCHDRCLVRRALKLLASSRIIERDWTFPGQNSHRIDVITDRECPWFGKRPITPVMDTQLDQIVIQTFLTPLRSGLLEDLNLKMMEGKKHDWFELFLVTFILQTHTALLLRHSRKNAIQCGAARRYNSLSLAEEYFHGSNILLAHFIHGGNGIPRLLQGKATTIGIHPNQEEFLLELVNSVHSQKTNVLVLRGTKAYETDMYWTHQMFFDGWVPEDRTIADA